MFLLKVSTFTLKNILSKATTSSTRHSMFVFGRLTKRSLSEISNQISQNRTWAWTDATLSFYFSCPVFFLC